MESIFIVIIFIILLAISKLLMDYNKERFIDNPTDTKITENDAKYYEKFYKLNKMNKMNSLLNNNKLDKINYKKNKILFLTFDNRENIDYVQIHNLNITKYVKKFDYEYKFLSHCDKNVYWCKIHLVLKELETNNYDYVIWLDSDTVIQNFNIDIGDILNMFSSDIYVGSDNNDKYNIINAGVFIISNTTIGKNFLLDCINSVYNGCYNNDKTLKGIWAGSCYEQGIMNILINDKYYSNTTILSNKIIFNYDVCINDVFIMHLYASSSDKRMNCFLHS